MVHSVTSEPDFGNNTTTITPLHSDTKPDIKSPKSELSDSMPEIKIPKSELSDSMPEIKIPKSEMVSDTHLSDDVKPVVKPPKPEIVVKPELVEENLDEEEWVTVYGFTYGDTEAVLQEFGKCGIILDHYGKGNWMHILYQNQTEAQQALSKSGKQINKDLILGVNPVDPIQKQALNERERKSDFADQIRKALHGEISLLHRSEGDFFVLAANGNVYNVTLSTTPSCRCNCLNSEVPCKHILFVFLRVLGISQNDYRIWRKGLQPSQLADLLSMPTPEETLACADAREEFHRLLSKSKVKINPPREGEEADDDYFCPDCGDERVEEPEICWDVGQKRKYHVCSNSKCRQQWLGPKPNWYTNLADYMD